MFYLLGFVSCAYPVGQTCSDVNRIYDCGMELICVNATCQFCESDPDCDSGYYCRTTKDPSVTVCLYEPLAHTWDWRLIVGFCTLFLVGSFVSGAGIGGGVLFVPIMILIDGFPAEYSISSSNPIILGGSFAVTLFNFRRHHSVYNRPLINYNVAAIIEPLSWLGTIIGVIVNGVIPDWMLYLCQFCLFGLSAYLTFQKGLADYRKRHAKVAIELEDVTQGPSLTQGGTIVDVLNPENADPEKPPEIEPGPQSQIQTQSQTESGETDIVEKVDNVPEPPDDFNKKKAFNPWTMVILGVVWAVFVVLPFLRGGRIADSLLGLPFCSTVYWIVTFAPFPVYMAVSGVMIWMAKQYPVVGEKADLDWKQITYLVTFGLIAGVASGFLGIGGGLIKGPILLKLGLEAEEMAATSSFMILLTSAITAIQFVARGTMPYSEFGIYIALGFVAFLVGMNILKIIITKTNNRAIVLYILGAVIGVASVLMSYLGIANVVYAVKNHQNMGFRPYCQGGDEGVPS
jgi:uncharacterized membrane protein YfcA